MNENDNSVVNVIEIPPYKPTIDNEHKDVSDNIKNCFASLNNKFTDTLGMVNNVLKEHRDTLSEDEINSSDRTVRTAREDKFFKAMELLGENINSISDSISELVKVMDSKNEEQDQALINMNKSTNDAFLSTSNSINSTKNELNNSINSTKNELNNSINSTKNELNNSINSTKNELNNSIGSTTEELNKMIEDAKKEIEKAKSELSCLFPIGTIISIPFNLDNAEWTGLEDTWLKCDGKLIPEDEKYNKLRELLKGTFHDTTLNLPSVGTYYNNIVNLLNRYGIPEDEKCTILSMNWSDYCKFWKNDNNQQILDSENTLIKRLKFISTKKEYFAKTKWELRFNGSGHSPSLLIDDNRYLLNSGYEAFVRILTDSQEEGKKEFRYWIGRKYSSNLVSSTANDGTTINHLPSTEFIKRFPSVKGVNKESTISKNDESGLIDKLECKAYIEVWQIGSSTSIGGNYGGICTPNMSSSISTLQSSGPDSSKGKGLEVNLSLIDNMSLLEEGYDNMYMNIFSMDWYIKYLDMPR